MAPNTMDHDQQDTFPQTAAYLQDPSTSAWAITIKPTASIRGTTSDTASPQGSPLTPPQRLARLPRLRPTVDGEDTLDTKTADIGESPRVISNAEWWLTLTPPEPKEGKKPRAHANGEAMRFNQQNVPASASPKLGAGHKFRADRERSANGNTAAKMSFASSTDEDVSPLKYHKREYSSDTITSPTTILTGKDSSVSDFAYDTGLFNGSPATAYNTKLLPQQCLNRIIRKVDLGTLATDLDKGFYNQDELSAGIKHAYGLLQDQVILRAQVKVQLQEAGWEPGAEEWFEECHAFRFKDVRHLIPDDLFKSWVAEDEKKAIQYVVHKRLIVSKETEALRNALRAVPGLREKLEKRAEYQQELMDLLVTIASLAFLLIAFVFLKETH